MLIEVVLQEVVRLDVALREVVLREAVALQERVLIARVPHPENATPTLSTRVENQDHANRVLDQRPMIIINE